MGIVERFDSNEDQRIKRLKSSVKRLNTRNAKPYSPASDHDKKVIARGPKFTFSGTPSGHKLGIYDPIVAAAIVIRKLESQQKAISLMSKPVDHVKNGKPLTDHGAKLLGWPWVPRT